MSTHKKVVLYNPQADQIYWKKGHPPLPLMAVSSLLDKENYKINIYDHTEKVEVIRNLEGAICLGITCMTGYQIKDGLLLAKMAKEKFPQLPIVWGGWHPTVLPQQTIENEFVDVVVRGQGQRTFTELVKTLEVKGNLSGISGIAYKKDGKGVINPMRQFEDINNFPALPFHLIDIEKYVAITRLGKRTIGYITSQGCPFRCGFCAEQVVYQRRWSGLKAEFVISEVQELVKRHKVDSLIFSDSNFFVDEKRVRDICQGIKGLHISWGQVNGRADTLTRYKPETWEFMRDSGLQCILVGAESGLQECLDIVEKDATIQDTYEISRITKRYGIRIQFSMMIGVPNPDKKYSIKRELYKTLDLIYKLHKINRDNEFLLFVYAPYVGTPLYAVAKQLGFKEPGSFEAWGNYDLNEKHVPWVSDKYARLTWDLTYYFFFVSNSLSKTIAHYSIFKRSLLMLFTAPLSLIVLLRFKTRFFLFPFEALGIRFFLKMKNKLQNLDYIKFKGFKKQ